MTTKQSDRLVFIFGLLFVFWFTTYPIVLWYMFKYDASKLYIMLWGVPGILLIGLPLLGPLIFVLMFLESICDAIRDKINDQKMY